MEQTILLGILIISIVSLCLVVATMIVTLTGQGKIKRTIRELTDSVTSMQRQLETTKQGRADEAFLSELKSAVSSAVANQMEYGTKQLKKQLEDVPKMQTGQIQSTMAMQETQKAGTVLCRSCYKPYSVTEKKCPFCQTRQSR